MFSTKSLFICNFDKRLFFFLFLNFIFATIIGTISHEFGHYLIAKYLGYTSQIHYEFTSWKKTNPNQTTHPIDGFWIILGGPLESMMTGSIGLILLFVFRKSFNRKSSLNLKQWLIIFLSLFWLRQLANFVTLTVKFFITGKYSRRCDELILAHYFHFHDWVILALTAFFAWLVLAIIVFKFIPLKQRFTFLTAGFWGGISGYVLWLILLGKYIMP